jgi:4-hydroxybenzoate polyprenyltransferase
MIDLILVLLGAAASLAGLWMMSPAICLLAFGAATLFIAYGRYKQAQSGVKTPNQATSNTKKPV